VEHYSDLYSKENTVSHSALEAIERLPTMDELDAEPTVVELSKAIDSLASGKAPGSDGIPPDLIKHCKTTLLLPLHEVLCQRHLSAQHRRKSICSSHSDSPTEAGRTSLP
jgi:hypothetical protein